MYKLLKSWREDDEFLPEERVGTSSACFKWKWLKQQQNLMFHAVVTTHTFYLRVFQFLCSSQQRKQSEREFITK